MNLCSGINRCIFKRNLLNTRVFAVVAVKRQYKALKTCRRDEDAVGDRLGRRSSLCSFEYWNETALSDRSIWCDHEHLLQSRFPCLVARAA